MLLRFINIYLNGDHFYRRYLRHADALSSLPCCDNFTISFNNLLLESDLSLFLFKFFLDLCCIFGYQKLNESFIGALIVIATIIVPSDSTMTSILRLVNTSCIVDNRVKNTVEKIFTQL